MQGGQPGQQQGGLDPAKLDFCRVLYDFPPPEAIQNGSFNAGLDLEVKKGDLVAVLDKSDPEGQTQGDSQWWRCRARDGRSGYLPAVYLETIQRKPAAQQITNESRANTMPASVEGSGIGRAETLASGRVESMASTRAQTLSSNGTGRAETMKSAAGQVGAKQAPELEVKKGKGDLEGMQKAWASER